MDLNEQLKGWLQQQAQPGSFMDKAGLGLAQAGQTLGQDAAAGAAIMNDPRNSWIGMNPVGKMAAGGLGMAGMLLGQVGPKAEGLMLAGSKELARTPAIMKLLQMRPAMTKGANPRIEREFEADIAAMAKLRDMDDAALGKLYQDGISRTQDAIDAGTLASEGAQRDKIDLFRKHIGAELSRRGLDPYPDYPYAFPNQTPLPFNEEMEQAVAAFMKERQGAP